MTYRTLLITILAAGCSAEFPVTAMQIALPIKISDVTGLSAALSQINNSIAILNTTTTNQSTALTNLNTAVANLNATVGNLNATVQSLVRVPTFVDLEIPGGSINGSNSVFTLSVPPSPASSLILIKNGMKLSPPGDYSLSGSTILFSAGAVPQTGDLVVASYRY